MTDDTRRRCRVDCIVLAVLIVAAGALRLHGIGSVAFVTDEVHSIHMATGSERHDVVAPGWTISVTAIPHQLATKDIHPPFYFVLLNLWLKLFGTAEGSARAFAIPFMLACIPLAYRIGLRLRGRAVGLTAAALLALSPFQIRYTQDLRMYGLMECLLLLATYLFLCLLDRPSRRLAIAYGVTIGLALLTHYFSIYVIFVHGLYYLIRRKHLKLSFKMFSLAMAIGAVLLLGWLGYAGRDRMKRTYTDTGWLRLQKEQPYFGPQLAGVSLVHMTEFVVGIKRWEGWEWNRVVMTVTLLPLLVLGIIALARERKGSLLIVLWIVVPFAGMVVVDLITGRKAFHLSRYLIGSALPCYFLFAAGVSFFRHRAARTALALLLAVAVGVGLWRHEERLADRPSYDKVAKAVVSAPRKAVLFPVMAASISYYVCDPSVELQRSYGMDGPQWGDLNRFLAYHDEILVVVPLNLHGGARDKVAKMVRIVKEKGFARDKSDGPGVVGSVRIDLYKRKSSPKDAD